MRNFFVMKAIVLLSGGLDSTTMLRIVQEMKYEVHAITFSYGQRHSVEIDAAKKVAQKYGIQNHRIVNIDLFGGSALTDNSLELNKSGKINAYDPEKENIPLSYVPARNTIFLSYALGFAEVIDAQKIFIGINAIDYSGYPDCRPEYLKKFNELAKLATAVGVKNELGPWNQYLGIIFHCLQYRARSSFDARKVMIQVNVDRIEHLWTLNGWFSYDDYDTNIDDDDSVNDDDDNSTATLNSKYGNIDDDDFFHAYLWKNIKTRQKLSDYLKILS